jgi:superfamily I DNA/RNA helicase
MPWIPNRSDFDDEQNRIFDNIIDDTHGSWWIKGYAGTGKTMMLIHLVHEYLQAGWDCTYVTYTHALKNLAIEALRELGNDDDELPVFTVDSLNAIGQTYDIVMVDEIQDLPEEKINNLLQLGERFIFSGDLNQSIFLNSANPDHIRRLIGNPRLVELRDIHRLPQAISFASHLVYEEAKSAENALVDVIEDSSVNLVSAATIQAEVDWNYAQALREARPSKPSAILFSKHAEVEKFVNILCRLKNIDPPPAAAGRRRRNADYQELNSHLEKNGLSLMYFGGISGGDIREATQTRKVLLMTIHSAKGLEFDSVFMPFMDYDRLPCPYPPLRNSDEWQRRFVYVALTRTKLNFYASYCGTSNEILDLLDNADMEDCLNIIEV